MDVSSFGIAGVAAITVVCYLIGLALGIVAMVIMPEFPATDYITAAAVGVVSGLAATGVNQVVKQLSNSNKE